MWDETVTEMGGGAFLRGGKNPSGEERGSRRFQIFPRIGGCKILKMVVLGLIDEPNEPLTGTRRPKAVVVSPVPRGDLLLSM